MVQPEGFFEEISGRRTVLDNLEKEDDKTRYWKTPSSGRIVRGGSVMTALDIVGSLFFTIYMMMVAQAMTEYEGRLVAVIDTLAAMMRIFSVLGFTGVGAKMVSEYLVRDLKEAGLYGAAASKYNFLMTGIPMITVASILYYLNSSGDPLISLAYFTLLIITICDRIRSCINIYVLAYKRYDLYAYSAYIPWAAQYIAAIFVYGRFGVGGVLVCFMFGNIISLIASTAVYLKISDFPLSDVFAWGKRYGLFRPMFAFNFLYSLANLIFAMLTTTLLISLGDSLGILTKREIVAIYTISTMSNILINTFEIVVPIMVSISEGHSLKNPKLINNYTMLCVKFPILMSIAVCTFYLIFGLDTVALFFGRKYTVMGAYILLMLVPAYIAGAFASRYDNIIAGIGRPEVVIVPWILTFMAATAGIISASLLPPEVYIIHYIDPAWNNADYGLTLRFAFALGTNAAALLVGGLAVTRICLKVLEVRIPAGFIYKPVLACAAVALIIIPVTRIFPIKEDFMEIFPSIEGIPLGGYVYIMMLAAVGIIMFLIFAVIFDALNYEDGKFWKHIIEGFGRPAVIAATPLFALGKALMKFRIKKLEAPPIVWITSTDRKELEKERLFSVRVVPLDGPADISEYPEEVRKLKGVPVNARGKYRFRVILSDNKRPLYDILLYYKLDTRKYPPPIYTEKLPEDSEKEYVLEVIIPGEIEPGVHRLDIVLEAYCVPSGRSAEELFRGGFWTYFDFRLKWVHIEDFFVNVLPPLHKP